MKSAQLYRLHKISKMILYTISWIGMNIFAVFYLIVLIFHILALRNQGRPRRKSQRTWLIDPGGGHTGKDFRILRHRSLGNTPPQDIPLYITTVAAFSFPPYPGEFPFRTIESDSKLSLDCWLQECETLYLTFFILNEN